MWKWWWRWGNVYKKCCEIIVFHCIACQCRFGGLFQHNFKTPTKFKNPLRHQAISSHGSLYPWFKDLSHFKSGKWNYCFSCQYLWIWWFIPTLHLKHQINWQSVTPDLKICHIFKRGTVLSWPWSYGSGDLPMQSVPITTDVVGSTPSQAWSWKLKKNIAPFFLTLPSIVWSKLCNWSWLVAFSLIWRVATREE